MLCYSSDEKKKKTKRKKEVENCLIIRSLEIRMNVDRHNGHPDIWKDSFYKTVSHIYVYIKHIVAIHDGIHSRKEEIFSCTCWTSYRNVSYWNVFFFFSFCFSLYIHILSSLILNKFFLLMLLLLLLFASLSFGRSFT